MKKLTMIMIAGMLAPSIAQADMTTMTNNVFAQPSLPDDANGIHARQSAFIRRASIKKNPNKNYTMAHTSDASSSSANGTTQQDNSHVNCK